MGTQQYVLVADLANEFEIDRSGTRKWLKERGFALIRVRPGGHGQSMGALTLEEAERARQKRLEEGFVVRLPQAQAS